MEVHGLPPRRLLERATRRKIFFDSNWAPRIVPNSAGRKRLPGSLDLAAVLRCSDAGFLSFLKVGAFQRFPPLTPPANKERQFGSACVNASCNVSFPVKSGHLLCKAGGTLSHWKLLHLDYYASTRLEWALHQLPDMLPAKAG